MIPPGTGCERISRSFGHPRLNVGCDGRLHAFVIRATAAFGYDPVDNLVGIGDIARFAVDAIRGVDFQLQAAPSFTIS